MLGLTSSLSILQVDLSAVCYCLSDVRLFTVYQSDEIRSRWRQTPTEGQGPQWGLAVAKWRSSATKAAAAIVEGGDYIALLMAAFDRVFDSDQELQELAGHTYLREVLRTEVLPRQIKAMQTNLLQELGSIISSAFVPVYQWQRRAGPSLIDSVNTQVKDGVIGLVITQVFDSLVETPLELPASVTHQFQLEAQQYKQEQQKQLAEDRCALHNALSALVDGPAQVDSTDSPTSTSSLNSFMEV